MLESIANYLQIPSQEKMLENPTTAMILSSENFHEKHFIRTFLLLHSWFLRPSQQKVPPHSFAPSGNEAF
jgi:hypothetical protein